MPRSRASFRVARYGVEVFHTTEVGSRRLRPFDHSVGDEGGLRRSLAAAEDALEAISTAIEKAGYKLGEQIFIALDPTASEFSDSKKLPHFLHFKSNSKEKYDKLINYYAGLCAFSIISIEDGCAPKRFGR